MPINKQTTRFFRFTCKKENIVFVQDLLKAQNFIFEPDPFLPLTHRAIQEPFPLGRSLAAFWGLIYIQDRSSMLPALALKPCLDDVILDMCASPGSKTSLLAQLVGKNGLVVGNEPSKTRLITLRKNLLNLNLFNTVTCSWAAEKTPMETESWEKILLDPPCSGWGTSAKHPQTLTLWKGNRIVPLIKLQQKLLTEAARLLRPGGLLIYSTCTTNIDENEAQVCFAQESLNLKVVPLEPFPGFSYTKPLHSKCKGTLRIAKNDEYQGFYIACLQKPSSKQEKRPILKHKNSPIVFDSICPNSFSINTKDFPQGTLGAFGSSIHFLPQTALSLLPQNIYWQGPFFGKYSGGKVIPSPRMRVFSQKTLNKLPQLHIDDSQILEKLIQGQSLQTTLSGKNAILFWKELPLGMIRLKNSRAFWSEK